MGILPRISSLKAMAVSGLKIEIWKFVFSQKFGLDEDSKVSKNLSKIPTLRGPNCNLCGSIPPCFLCWYYKSTSTDVIILSLKKKNSEPSIQTLTPEIVSIFQCEAWHSSICRAYVILTLTRRTKRIIEKYRFPKWNIPTLQPMPAAFTVAGAPPCDREYNSHGTGRPRNLLKKSITKGYIFESLVRRCGDAYLVKLDRFWKYWIGSKRYLFCQSINLGKNVLSRA